MRILPVLSICWAGLAWAQPAVPLGGEDKQLLDARAKALHSQADSQRAEAEASFAAESKSCWDKFLVSACLDDAKKAKNEKLAAVRRIEQEAREIERDLRQRNFAEHEARKAAEAPQRAADAAAQAEKNRQAQQEAMARVERKRVEAEQRGK